ncbi:MAG: lytic murein transglycosylase [Nitrospiraceae bacterium]|nr:MAG: lytic murein transglycosylase [Nitrospiraceae bacterium]
MEKSMRDYFIVVFLAMLAVTAMPCVHAGAVEFAEWLDAFRQEARAQGITEDTLERAFAGVEPIPLVIELDRNQPEFKKDFRAYLDLMVNKRRISRGRLMLARHSEILEKIRRHYGVQPRFIVALWGLETDFGSMSGGFPVVGALATLAHDSRRSAFFEAELLHALKILDEGRIGITNMEGSWAGAMGQVQFMPSTYVRYAVDEDRDGRKDIWSSLPDAFASAANYLSDYGWRAEMTWGRQVTLPDGYDENASGLSLKTSLAAWQEAGVRKVDGENLPVYDTDASLVLPSGIEGPAFLVYQNYRAVMRWNPSHLYALAVCHLADRLVGGGPLEGMP